MEKYGLSFSLVIILALSLTLTLVSSQEQSLGTSKQNECVRLIQTCGNCTYNNISSVLIPNKTVAINQVVMVKSGTEYAYTFCNTTNLGEYIVNGFGDVDGVNTVWAYGFTINGSGTQLSTGQSLVYILGVILLFFFTLKLMAFAIFAEKDPKIKLDPFNINWNKYLRIGGFFIGYLLLVISVALTYGLVSSFTIANFLNSPFYVGYMVLLAGIIPLFLIMIFFAGFSFFNELKNIKLTERGLDPHSRKRGGRR